MLLFFRISYFLNLIKLIIRTIVVIASVAIDMYEKCKPKSILVINIFPVNVFPRVNVILASAKTRVNVNNTCSVFFIV